MLAGRLRAEALGHRYGDEGEACPDGLRFQRASGSGGDRDVEGVRIQRSGQGQDMDLAAAEERLVDHLQDAELSRAHGRDVSPFRSRSYRSLRAAPSAPRNAPRRPSLRTSASRSARRIPADRAERCFR